MPANTILPDVKLQTCKVQESISSTYISSHRCPTDPKLYVSLALGIRLDVRSPSTVISSAAVSPKVTLPLSTTSHEYTLLKLCVALPKQTALVRVISKHAPVPPPPVTTFPVTVVGTTSYVPAHLIAAV